MGNELTGDFDVVAEFTVPAANRVLAAMHRGGRLPHTWSLRVDDYADVRPGTPAVAGLTPTLTGIRSAVDSSGEALANPAAVVNANGAAGPRSGNVVNPNVDVLVNQPKSAAAIIGSAIDPANREASLGNNPASSLTPGALARATHLTGVAQLQLGAPTVTVLDNSRSSVTVHTPVMARYISDPGSLEIPSLLHGEFQTTVRVQQTSSAAGTFINVNLAGPGGNASFIPKWVSPTWDAERDQLAAIDKALVNSLRTSFEPSSTALPANVLYMQLKTLGDGTQPALTMMMNLPGGIMGAEILAGRLGLGSGAPDPATVTNVFLTDGDDFAFAVRNDFVQGMFASSQDDLQRWSYSFSYNIETTIPNPVSAFGIGPDSWTVKVVTINFTTVIDSVAIDFQDSDPDHPNGWILVTVQGTANTPTEGIPKITFTATQALTLELIDSAYGSTADLVTLGDPSLTIDAPGVPDTVIDSSIKPGAKDKFTTQVQTFLNQINPGLQNKLSAKNNLGDFLGQLMNPAPKPGSPPVERIDPRLKYTAFEITSSGVVLHGSLAVPAWPNAQVEYSFRTVPHPGPVPRAIGEYNAFKSWIPGGTIQEHIWSQADGPPLHDDHHTFLFQEQSAEPLLEACLTIKGSRISASGPVGYETVTAQGYFCAWHFPVSAQRPAFSAKGLFDDAQVALTRRTVSGGIEVVGHTSPWAPAGTAPPNATNLVVHFPDQQSLAGLDVLARALKERRGTNAAAAIVVVLSSEHLAQARFVDGILVADDEEPWAQLLSPKVRPATFLIDTQGDVIWQHQGPARSEELAAALRAHLPDAGGFTPRLLTASVRAGQPTPNFLFQTPPGDELTLRKLRGRPVVLVFWRSSSQASIETVRDVQQAFARAGNGGPVVLAINDGESPEEARRAATEGGLAALIVDDPARDIALAYGINVCPTSIFLDGAGLVTGVRYGRFSGEIGGPPSERAAD